MSTMKRIFACLILLAATVIASSAHAAGSNPPPTISTKLVDVSTDPMGRVAACGVAHALLETSCVAPFLSQAVFPNVIPLKITGIHFDPVIDKPTDKVDVEFDIEVEVESISVESKSGALGEFAANVKANAVFRKIKSKVATNEVLKDTRFRVGFEASAILKSAALPAEAECRDTRPLWAALALNFKLTALKGVKVQPMDAAGVAKLGIKIPSFLTNNGFVLGVINWVFQDRVFQKVEGAPMRGIPICMTVDGNAKPNCPNLPMPTNVQIQDKIGLIFGGNSTKAVALDLSTVGTANSAQGAPLDKRVTSAETLQVCNLVSSVVAHSCTTELGNRVFGYALPFAAELPADAMGTKGIRAIVKSATIASSGNIVSATAKAALSNGTPDEFAIEGAGSISLTPTCKGRSFAMTFAPKFDRLTVGAKIPPWVLDGLVRTLVNRTFDKNDPLSVPLKSLPLKEVSSEIRFCGIVDRLLKSNDAHELANTLAGAVLPIEIKVSELLANAVKLPDSAKDIVAGVFNGVTITLSSVSVTGASTTNTINIAVEVKKAGMPDSFKASGQFLIDAKPDCATKGKEQLSLQFQVGSLSAGEVPKWLTESTATTLLNNLFARPRKVCLLGKCE